MKQRVYQLLNCVLLIMHNYHAIYVLIYYSGIRVKNLNFGLKNILVYYYCVLLTCINTMHYCVLCIIFEYYYC